MPASPYLAQSLAEETARIYEAAEYRILGILAANLAKGVDRDDWERGVLQRLQTLRPQVLAMLAESNPAAAKAIAAGLEEAYSVGMLAAYQQAGAAATPAAHTAAVTALATATLDRTSKAVPHLLRAVDDAARRVVAEVVGGTTTGSLLRKDALQQALNGLVKSGFARVPVGRGEMDAADYARMAVRTGTARAMIDGHVQAITDLDLNLVTIVPGPRACETCDYWAGMVLSTDGSQGTMMLPNLGDADADVEVTVDGSLDQAEIDGVFHPNCRCSISAYLPGLTDRRGVEDRPAWDAEGYHAQQAQRGIERAIRQAKQVEAVALSEEARREAHGQVRDQQARMREHLQANPDLKRQSAREQILAADGD